MTNQQAYAGLLERLVRNTKDMTAFCPEPIYRNPDGPEAAEAISSLLKREEAVAEALRRAENNWGGNRGAETVIHLVRAALNSDAPLSIGEGDRG